MSIEFAQNLYATHEVENQPPPLPDHNPYQADHALAEAVQRYGGEWMEDRLTAFGEKTGRTAFAELGTLANKCAPELKTHDQYGARLDEVAFHPAYHELMRTGIAAEMHALPWNQPRRGAHVARAAIHYLLSQVEAGVGCPITMSFASVPALRLQPELAAEWAPRVTATAFDARVIPAEQKTQSMIGMGMTEKQGGSDVRANTTRAVAAGPEGPGREYLLTGHKWFVSGCMADAFLMTAQTERGLSCFLVPRFLPDGTKNRLFLLRLKDKVGNRSNATAEVELLDAWGRMVGEEGRGVPTIIEMVNHTRLDCTIGMASLMRRALVLAIHHCMHRAAFGATLADQPLMRNVLADLALESEAATAIMMRMASAYDAVAADPAARPFARILTAIGKYWVCKQSPQFVYECMECVGGSGYVEDWTMPRLYREAPVCAIWEGSGNVISLDLLRALAKEPEGVAALHRELEEAQGLDARYDQQLAQVLNELRDTADLESRARRLIERLAITLQAAMLLRFAPNYVAEAFLISRLERDRGAQYGTLPSGQDTARILGRAWES